MEGNIQVTLSELMSAAERIAQANDRFLQTADALKRSADSLAEKWEGEDQVAFVTEQAVIDVWYRRMSEAVTEYVQAMKYAAQKYEDADREMAEHIKSH